jgi:hypothetical protein
VPIVSKDNLTTAKPVDDTSNKAASDAAAKTKLSENTDDSAKKVAPN